MQSFVKYYTTPSLAIRRATQGVTNMGTDFWVVFNGYIISYKSWNFRPYYFLRLRF